MTEPIRFLIGTDVNGGCLECQMVLEYSIKKHCSRPYEIHWMKISDDPSSFWYGWNTSRWSTPFSGFRYGIPEFCGFQGKALYQDDDQLWLSDPSELWDIEIPDDKIMTGKRLKNGEIRHCVSLIDCERFGQKVPIPVSRRKANESFTETMKNVTFPLTHVIGNEFNCYDGENLSLDEIKVLHMTDMSSNPGVHLAVKRLGDQSKHWYNGPLRQHRRQDVVDLFNQYYQEALDDGFKVEDYLPENRVFYKMNDQSQYKANNGWDVTQGE